MLQEITAKPIFFSHTFNDVFLSRFQKTKDVAIYFQLQGLGVAKQYQSWFPYAYLEVTSSFIYRRSISISDMQADRQTYKMSNVFSSPSSLSILTSLIFSTHFTPSFIPTLSYPSARNMKNLTTSHTSTASTPSNNHYSTLLPILLLLSQHSSRR